MSHALLIDGENVSSAHAPAILAATTLQAAVRRVYGDVSRLNGWLEVADLRAVHAAPGRNAADILLAVEAMDLLHRRGLHEFTLATSDGGLVHLVAHPREAGATVTVVGEAKACEALRRAAHRFIELAPQRSAPPALPAPAAKALPATRPMTASPVETVKRLVQDAGPDGLGMAELSRRLQSLHPQDLATWLGTKGPRAFVEAHPQTFAVDPAIPGSRVRLAYGE